VCVGSASHTKLHVLTPNTSYFVTKTLNIVAKNK